MKVPLLFVCFLIASSLPGQSAQATQNKSKSKSKSKSERKKQDLSDHHVIAHIRPLFFDLYSNPGGSRMHHTMAGERSTIIRRNKDETTRLALLKGLFDSNRSNEIGTGKEHHPYLKTVTKPTQKQIRDLFLTAIGERAIDARIMGRLEANDGRLLDRLLQFKPYSVEAKRELVDVEWDRRQGPMAMATGLFRTTFTVVARNGKVLGTIDVDSHQTVFVNAHSGILEPSTKIDTTADESLGGDTWPSWEPTR